MQKIPYILVLLGMLGGVGIAILFGVNEDLFQNKIESGLKQNPKYSAFTKDEERSHWVEKEREKCWRYYQRYHFHATGISAMVLALLILVSHSSVSNTYKLATNLCTSIGGVGYPFVWLLAAIYGPVMGRGAAKESFAIFGYMGGVFLIGIVLSLIVVIRDKSRLIQ